MKWTRALLVTAIIAPLSACNSGDNLQADPTYSATITDIEVTRDVDNAPLDIDNLPVEGGEITVISD